MVSSIDSTRLWSMQTAIRTFKENNSSDTSGDTLRSSLLSQYGADDSSSSDGSTSLADYLTSDSSSDDSTYGLPASLTQAIDTAQSKVDDSGDVSSTSFMKNLKQKLQELEKDPNTKDQAEQMLKALDNGTLTVTDAESGKQITAWDPDAKDAKATTATSTDTTDWSTFLRSHLTRQSGGVYSRNGDGSYVESGTGNSAYFGTIGDKYYYLSWKADSATSTSSTTA